MQLLDDEQVLFSGYRVPHPLEPAIQLKVQTRSNQPGPVSAVRKSLHCLEQELDTLQGRFTVALDTLQGRFTV